MTGILGDVRADPEGLVRVRGVWEGYPSVRIVGFISFYCITALTASNLVLEILKHDKIWWTICISVPLTPNYGRTRPPPSPVIYAHADKRHFPIQINKSSLR